MDEKNSRSQVSAEQIDAKPTTAAERTSTGKSAAPSAERADTESRKAYGTAKTENLRDSGLWRILLPGFIIVASLLLLAVPFIILVQLLAESLTPGAPTASLTWLWICMIILEIAIAAVIIWGLFKAFLSQPGYARS